MELKYISKGEMPPSNKYVLAYVSAPWFDSSDQHNVYWRVVKCVYGISMKQREEYSHSDSSLERKRSKIVKFGDEWGNNLNPYQFIEFGPSKFKFLGHEIDIWCELPEIN